jgi:hypothetical protein
LFNNLSANLRNFDGGLSLTAEGDFQIITIGAENLRVNSANGFIGIGNPASLTSLLTVNGSITQSVTSALLKTNASGTLVAAVAGTDYVIPSALSSYVPTSRTLTINGTTFDLSANRSWTISSGVSGTPDYIPRFVTSTTIGNSDISQDATFVTLNSRALSAPRMRLNTLYDNASLSINVFGQTYMDSRTSRLYQTFNLSSISNYMHIYDPYSTVNANGGFSIGSSTSITLLPSTSIIHFDGVNNRVGIGTTSPSAALSVVGAATFSSSVTVSGNTILGSGADDGNRLQVNGSAFIKSGNSLYIGNNTNANYWGIQSAGTGATALTFQYNSGASLLSIASTGAATFSSSVTITSDASANALILRTRSGDDYTFFNFRNNSGSELLSEIYLQRTAANTAYLAFSTNNGSSGPSERMRITSGGNLLLGTTSSVYSTAAKFEIQYSGAAVYGMNMRTTTGDAIHLNFVNQGGSQVGYIYSNNTNTQYTTSSDYRLKQDLKEFNGLNLISNIKTYDYEWKSDKSRMYGVIAHELQELLPQAVSGEKDGDRMQGVDYSMIVPILIKSIQEQQVQIEELKAMIAAK